MIGVWLAKGPLRLSFTPRWLNVDRSRFGASSLGSRNWCPKRLAKRYEYIVIVITWV